MKPLIFICLLVSSICHANHESGGLMPVAAIFVEFKSIGSGIDAESKQLFDTLVAEEKSLGHVMYETLVQTGREGEVRNCIELADSVMGKNFVRNLAPAILEDRSLTSSVRTSVYTGTNCDIFESATEDDLNKY